MAKDKYSATWVSHTSLSDYLKCPRAYYLKNVYKDKKTGHKIQIAGPSLSLGSAVHEVVESLSILPTNTRFETSPIMKFEHVWEKYSGKRGGFTSIDQEHHFKERGKKMINRVVDHPGPVAKKAVKINQELPYYWISEDENIILCGKIDWLEYLEESDSVHIIDFKTSKREEEEGSLQLPIYLLLATNCQTRKVVGASYWYLDLSDDLVKKELPLVSSAESEILRIARQVKLARKLEKFSCPNKEDGCMHCRDYEAIIKGEGELVGDNDNRQDIYFLDKGDSDLSDSIIL